MRYATSKRSVPSRRRVITQNVSFLYIQEKLKKEKTDKKPKKVTQISEKMSQFGYEIVL